MAVRGSHPRGSSSVMGTRDHEQLTLGSMSTHLNLVKACYKLFNIERRVNPFMTDSLCHVIHYVM